MSIVEAVKADDEKAVKDILSEGEGGVDLSRIIEDGNNLFHYVKSFNVFIRLVNYARSNSIDIKPLLNHKNNKGETPLHNATTLTVILAMLHNGASPIVENIYLVTPVEKNANKLDIRCVIALLRSMKPLMSEENYNRVVTGLLFITPYPEVARYLISEGADANGDDLTVENVYDGVNTPLHSNPNIIGVLLAQPNIHIDAVDDEGATPLMRHAENNNVEACRLLIEAGANVNFVSDSDLEDMPLFYAHSYEVAEMMVKRGATLDTVDADGVTVIEALRRNGLDEDSIVRLRNLQESTEPEVEEKKESVRYELLPAFSSISKVNSTRKSRKRSRSREVTEAWENLLNTAEDFASRTKRSRSRGLSRANQEFLSTILTQLSRGRTRRSRKRK